jgi:uroporphyrinogen-III synthase
MGNRWDAVAVPMSSVKIKEDRNFPRFTQQLQQEHFSIAVFTDLLSARFLLQAPRQLVRAAASELRGIPVVAQAPEVAQELSGLNLEPLVPARSSIIDFLDEQGENLEGKDMLLFTGEPFDKPVSAALKKYNVKVERLATYSCKMLKGKEQEEAVEAVLDGDVRAVSFESRIAVDSFFKIPETSRGKRQLAIAMEKLTIRALNPVVAEVLAKNRVDARVPQIQDLSHLFT